MPWTDGHLDLAYLAVSGRDLRRTCPDPATGCVSLPELRAASIGLAFATIYTSPGDDGPAGYGSSDDLDGAAAAGERQLAVYETLEAEGELAIVRAPDDLSGRDGDGTRPHIVLLMEGADPIRTPESAAWWHARGLRLVGLAWAVGTRYAGGNASGGPLTPLGIELVAALDALGIIHDASHLSDAAFDDLLTHTRGTVVATHSNCRALMSPSERHLRDDQIRALAERDGVVGLNLFSRFLATDRRATVHDCVAHVEHVAEIMGHRQGVALGSDMDGGFGPDALPEEVDHPTRLDRLTTALANAGWTEEDLDGFREGNWHRLLERAWNHGPEK